MEEYELIRDEDFYEREQKKPSKISSYEEFSDTISSLKREHLKPTSIDMQQSLTSFFNSNCRIILKPKDSTTTPQLNLL